ncbi:hypothetical protein E8E13_001411 [Curvularia kusanoi]|uniref:Heterokaryon incompatibility domain-containing protein n=1 Tax=Curvularia kusanoi TaxID=90978 RepID=A0A9P4T4C4_CURKU|nr:hypothetical protein E8E13_001411 [Curvularia kusanoi]
MWLLNTHTFKLEEFYSDVPSYAILSHRWQQDEEVSFGGLEGPHPYSNRAGYKKIKDFCAEAQRRRLAYVWVDTCCIDKKSSAELSEAINSMYTYYNQAKICYVYLYDVDSMKDFRQSSWFTRGWTLQELLAPPKLHFFNHVWKPISSRRKLASKIGGTTGIPVSALQHLDLAGYCVAEKFSWSAYRQTTREEDRAYCLLGLFQINMPLLYGEGARAFHRLQEEIMKTSTDMSIFMWQGLAEDFSEIFDTEMHMAFLQGDQQALESRTDMGISLEISDASRYAGLLETEINFDIEEFIQHYVPNADVSHNDYSEHIPRSTFESLLDAGIKIDAERQNKHFF